MSFRTWRNGWLSYQSVVSGAGTTFFSDDPQDRSLACRPLDHHGEGGCCRTSTDLFQTTTVTTTGLSPHSRREIEIMPIRVRSASRLLAFLPILLITLPTATVAGPRNIHLPFLSKKQYTPLVFFTAPSGAIPGIEVAERAVRRIERELNVRVERLDVFRDPSAEACWRLVTGKKPPFLYNRLTRQIIHIPLTPSAADSEDGAQKASPSKESVHVDMDRLRAWAKNRLLTKDTVPVTAKTQPILLSVPEEDETDMDRAELLEDMTLTPRQKEGKEKIKQRTYSRGQEKGAKK